MESDARRTLHDIRIMADSEVVALVVVVAVLVVAVDLVGLHTQTWSSRPVPAAHACTQSTHTQIHL